MAEGEQRGVAALADGASGGLVEQEVLAPGLAGIVGDRGIELGAGGAEVEPDEEGIALGVGSEGMEAFPAAGGNVVDGDWLRPGFALVCGAPGE